MTLIKLSLCFIPLNAGNNAWALMKKVFVVSIILYFATARLSTLVWVLC